MTTEPTSTAPAANALLPCPFCGNEPTRYPDGDMEGYAVMCSADTGACRMTTFGHASQAEADAAWNRRASAQPQAQEPVHWLAVLAEDQRPHQLNESLHRVGFRKRRSAESWIAEQEDFKGWTYTLVPLYAAPSAPPDQAATPSVAELAQECHKLDTPTQVFFYEQDFYVLSNFSAFRLRGWGRDFDTSEHAYHWHKFQNRPDIQDNILCAESAHEAFKFAEWMKQHRRPDWDDVKVGIMRDILRAKADQHEYVRRKLLATGDRELIEDSWRDDFWGWGPNRDGQNMLGKLWMEIRAELRAAPQQEQK